MSLENGQESVHSIYAKEALYHAKYLAADVTLQTRWSRNTLFIEIPMKSRICGQGGKTGYPCSLNEHPPCPLAYLSHLPVKDVGRQKTATIKRICLSYSMATRAVCQILALL